MSTGHSGHRRAVLVDCGLGLGAVVVGAIGLPALSTPALILATVGGIAQAVAAYVVEQLSAWNLLVEHHPESVVLAFVLTLGVAVLLIVGGTVARAPFAAFILGMGAGFVLYRVTFGVVRPLPVRRREQVERLGW